VQQHAASFIAHTEASTASELPRFIKDEFDAFLERGILAHGFLRLRCGACSHDKLLVFSCKRRGFCPSGGARRMSQTAAQGSGARGGAALRCLSRLRCRIPFVATGRGYPAAGVALRAVFASNGQHQGQP